MRAGPARGLLLALLLACSGGVALAAEPACLPVAGGGELSVAGVGRVVFAGLTTDRVRDAASLTGSVCLAFEGVDGVLRTERLELTGLSADVSLTASDVVLELPGWTLMAATLASDGRRARLGRVAMEGVEAVARAVAVDFLLETGEVSATGLRLVTETVWLDAETATLDGRIVQARGAWLTTCDCPPEESPLRLRAEAVRIDMTGMRLRLEGAALSIDDWLVPLPDPWELDESRLADLSLPVTLGADPEGLRGLILAGREREVLPGVRYVWDVGSGGDGRPPDVGVGLGAVADGVSAELVGGSERVRVAWRVRRPLGGGWAVGAHQRLEGGAWREPARDQGVTLGWTRSFEPGWPDVDRIELAASASAALSAQTLEGADVVGPRLGFDASLESVGVDLDGSRLGLDLAGGLTRYPAQDAFQAWGSLTPTWTHASGPWRLALAHQSRWVVGGSPFGTTLDRVSPAHRTDVALGASTTLSGDWRLDSSLDVRVNWAGDAERPGRMQGIDRLRVGFDLAGAAWGGRWEIDASTDLAGWVDPHPERVAEARFGVVWTRGGLEFGGRADVAWAPEAPGWREVVVFGAWPVVRGDWAWRPYLAFDLAAVGRGGAGWWSGHGLELTWTSCCGIVEVGYRHDAGLGTRVHAGLTFESHGLDLERLASYGAAPATSGAR